MSHTIRDKQKLIKRVGRIGGQIEALKRALEEEQDCGRVLHLIAASRGAMNSLMSEVLEGHLRAHFEHPASGSRRTESVEEIVDVVRAYLK
jgi:FrmR/RcnR family transcriptional regulator, repressor of frmRAB operon